VGTSLSSLTSVLSEELFIWKLEQGSCLPMGCFYKI
jgi:hypothetical protein